ncbi:hypothetical protein [Mariniblastus fucicola]|uniref:Uncharacterized protein n=1 Tax=Mariniblastus fucicola TaxID=980251 RepID=A0A5B9P563_9BACT|nr:hypothetical protein [Mariniblastus fucicola]QEG21538.1 hypothetical protein MFFC18_13940 [Mariniblastus fucicola]
MSRKTKPKGPDPGAESVAKYLNYTLSLPERAIRSTAAIVGGFAQQSAVLLVPSAFQDSKTYKTFVKQMLDMVAHDIGGAKRAAGEMAPDSDAQVEGYVAKKTVSTFVDLAGMATLHVSPMTILAVMSDVAYGSNVYLKQLADELKREGIIDKDSTIDHAADLLDAIGSASGKAADRFDQPPLSLDGLRETIEEAQESVGTLDPTKVIPQAEIKRMWSEMQHMADDQDVDLIDVSSAMTMYTLNQVATVSKGALTTIRVTGKLLDEHLIDHYWQGLQRINDEGIWQMFATSSQPYIEAVWVNFSSDKETITEDVVSGRFLSRTWTGFCDWLGG